MRTRVVSVCCLVCLLVVGRNRGQDKGKEGETLPRFPFELIEQVQFDSPLHSIEGSHVRRGRVCLQC